MSPPSRLPAAPLPTSELSALLQLHVLPQLRNRVLRELLARYGSAEAALAAPWSALPANAARAAASRQVRERVPRALRAIERLGVEIILETDARYPERLTHLADPPVILYARGRLELLHRPCIAVVGARRHTDYGATVARTLAGDFARAGLPVISGLARGIDAVAHAAALPDTVGVLGCGIDVVYPPEHRLLQQRIAAEGLLLSVFPPGAPPIRRHFPARNRIIAALARGVVVVEASHKSGALSTAAAGRELGREIGAVPGPIGRETSLGTNALINDGVKLVTCAADMLFELGIEPAPEPEAAATPAPGTPPMVMDLAGTPAAVLAHLTTKPMHVDEVADACALTPAAALAALLELELCGRVRQHPGKRFAPLRV